jgi:hypothetical protein
MGIAALSHWDFGFDFQRVKRGAVHHQVPIGMPKIRQALIDNIFYLFGRDPKSGEIAGPLGTGFFVRRSEGEEGAFVHHYAVTNWHVAVRSGGSIIRLNTRDGKSRLLEYDPSDWYFEAGKDDIAIIDVTDDLVAGTDAIFVQAEDTFLTRETIEKFEIGFGEDAFMIGMFVHNHGKERNIPAARFGNLSMLANAGAPIEMENGAMRPAHLVDMRSRGGFSGSPVFIYRTPYTDLTHANMHQLGEKYQSTGFMLGKSGQASRKDWFIGLLGIHCAQFWEQLEVQKAPSKNERRGDPILEGDSLKVQGGMTIVAPSWCITDLLDSEKFETMRNDRENKLRGSSRQRPRAEAVETVSPPSNDANPTHREDFTRLVSLAARKPAPKD